MLSSSVHMGHVDLPRNVRPASRNTLSIFRRDLRQLLRCRCNTRVTTGNEPTTAAGLSSVGVSTAEAAPHTSQLGDSVAQQQPGTNSNLEAPINSVAAAAGTQAGLLGSGVSVDPQHKQAQQQQAAQFGLWPFQGLLSGTCLVAAGALACSFISLQVCMGGSAVHNVDTRELVITALMHMCCVQYSKCRCVGQGVQCMM
jgi:hypothetical protein